MYTKFLLSFLFAFGISFIMKKLTNCFLIVISVCLGTLFLVNCLTFFSIFPFGLFSYINDLWELFIY